MRGELLGRLPASWADDFSSLLRKLVEPGLEPYYRKLGPGFFDRFLPPAPVPSAPPGSHEVGE